MNKKEVKATLRKIAEELADTDYGASINRVQDTFMDRYGDAAAGLGEVVLNDWIRTESRASVERLKKLRGTEIQQLQLVEMPDVEPTVTVLNEDGTHSIKLSSRATPDDVDAYIEMLYKHWAEVGNKVTQWEEARNAYNEVCRVNGLATWGDAIRFLAAQSEHAAA